MTAWETSLYAAARFILKCPNCKRSYHHDQRLCPCCDVSRPEYLLVTVEDLALDCHKTLNDIRKVTSWCLQYLAKFTFTRCILGFIDEEADKPILEVQIYEKLRTFTRLISQSSPANSKEAFAFANQVDAGVVEINEPTGSRAQHSLRRIQTIER